MAKHYDLLIIGGGINGTSIARAASVAGQRVLLVEQGDLAQATSSASTKLMHGGLRYLEQYEIKLVRAALKERAIMLRTAPHLVRPLEFRLPHDPHTRPWLLVRLGLWLYDALAASGNLPRSRGIAMSSGELKPTVPLGFSYWDGCVDDSRLVVLNAVDAAETGAAVWTRTRFESAVRRDGRWRAVLRRSSGIETVTASAIVNASGPWVDRVLCEGLGTDRRRRLRLVRGSHIILARQPEGDHAWLFQQPDGRIVFVIPYERRFTLIGTTEVPVERAEDDGISQAEIDYLIAAANRYLRTAVSPTDIVAHFSGIRPLFDDGVSTASKVSRDYHLELVDDGAPLLSVFGGKITTARHLAEVALDRLGIRHGHTRQRPLPGGEILQMREFTLEVERRWPFLGKETAERLTRSYGSRIHSVIGNATGPDDLGPDFGEGLTQREVDYLVRYEWAVSAEDILWRRSKLGLRVSPTQAARLQSHLQERGAQ